MCPSGGGGAAFCAWASLLCGWWRTRRSAVGQALGGFATKRAWSVFERETVPVARLELGLRTILRLSGGHTALGRAGKMTRHGKSFFGLVSFK